MINLQQAIQETAYYISRTEGFPAQQNEAIKRIHQLFVTFKSNNYQWRPEFFTDIVTKFIFRIYDLRDAKRSTLSTTEKLLLAEQIMTNLSYIDLDIDRYAMFSTIFQNHLLHKGDIPLLILSLMTSLSVISRNALVLKTLGEWLVDSGIDSTSCLYIANDICTDIRTDENSEKYSHLPHTAFLFTSVILIAMGKLFGNQGKVPPKRVITQITTWIENSPSVCFIPPHSSVFEIFRWVINSDEDESQLHLALLNSIMKDRDKQSTRTQLQTIPHLLLIISELQTKLQRDISNGRNNPEKIEKATERLLQLIQVLVGTECLDRNEMHPIFEALEQARFPQTKLYEVMRSCYLK